MKNRTKPEIPLFRIRRTTANGSRCRTQVPLVIGALMLWVGYAQAAMVTLQQGVTPRLGGGAYEGTTDSWLDETLRSRNYGASHELCIKYDMNDEGFLEDHAIIKFELPNLSFGAVNSATLELFYFEAESFLNDNAMGIKPYRVDPTKPWFENDGGPDGKPNEGVSYRYRDQAQTQEWTLQYGGWYDKIDDGNGTNLIKRTGGSVPGAIEPGNWVPFNVQPSVAQWYAGATNNGFLLFSCYFTGSQSIVWGRFSSRDTNNPIYRPKLTIGYQGAGINWAGSVNGNWDTNTANWDVGGYAGRFGDGDHVMFADGAANPSITVTSAGVAPASVTISNSATAYIFSGGRIGGPGGLIKRGAGQATLGSSNSYAGLTLVESGKLIVSANGALGHTTAGTTINPGAALGLENVNYATPEPLAIAGSGVSGSGALYASGTSLFGGTVLLNADSAIGVEPFGTLTLTNAVNGNSSLTKTGSGTLTFAGSVANTYSGDTYVNQGTVVLAKSAGEAVPGNLYIGDGVTPATVRFDNHGQLSGGDIDVVVNTGSQLNLNNFSAGIGGMLSLSNASVVTGTGTLALGGTLRSAGNQTNSVSGKLDLAGGVRAFVVGDGAAVDDLVVSATVGNGGITKLGSGKLVLTGNNTFDGPVTISEGQLAISSGTALGTTAGGTTVADGARLELLGGIAVGAEALTVNGIGGGLGALYSATGNNSWAGQITLGSAAAIGCDSAATLTLSGPVDAAGFDLSVYGGGNVTVHGGISGTGSSVTKTGPGVLSFAGTDPNTYTGPTTVSMGQLVLGKLGAMAVAGPITIGTMLSQASVVCMAHSQFGPNVTATINPSSLLDLNGFNGRLAGLSLVDAAVETKHGRLELSGPISCMGAVGSTINGNISFAGTQDINVKAGTAFTIGAAILSGGFNKLGGGVLLLTNANTVDAGCTINEGTVLVNNHPRAGFGLGPGPVAVQGRSVLGGSGSICGPVNMINGVLSPGTSVGTIVISNHVVLGAASSVRLDVAGPAPAIDTIDLRHGGALSIDSGAQLELVGMLEGPEPYIFVRGAQNVTGTFAGLPDGAELPGQPGWYIHYGTHRIYFSQVQNPIVYFRAFSTNGVVLLMWRTGEEVDTKWFDVYQWREPMWVQLNAEPILAQNPNGAVYLMVHPHPDWPGDENCRFKLVANTSDGEEAWIFDREVTEFKFSAFPRVTEQGVELRWLSRTDETYELQWTDDIGQPLVPVLTEIPATPPECVVVHHTTNTQGFYRVRMVP